MESSGVICVWFDCLLKRGIDATCDRLCDQCDAMQCDAIDQSTQIDLLIVVASGGVKRIQRSRMLLSGMLLHAANPEAIDRRFGLIQIMIVNSFAAAVSLLQSASTTDQTPQFHC